MQATTVQSHIMFQGYPVDHSIEEPRKFTGIYYPPKVLINGLWLSVMDHNISVAVKVTAHLLLQNLPFTVLNAIGNMCIKWGHHQKDAVMSLFWNTLTKGYTNIDQKHKEWLYVLVADLCHTSSIVDQSENILPLPAICTPANFQWASENPLPLPANNKTSVYLLSNRYWCDNSKDFDHIKLAMGTPNETTLSQQSFLDWLEKHKRWNISDYLT